MTASRNAPSPLAYGNPAMWPGGTALPMPAAVALLGGKAGRAWVLGIDQAATSGAAVIALPERRCVLHRAVRKSQGRRGFLRDMRALPGFELARLLVVLEDHGGIPLGNHARYNHATHQAPTRNADTLLGMGDARGRWLELLDILEHPLHLRIKVEPKEWRRVLSTRVNLGTDAWKAQARMWASAVIGAPILDDNEAEAIGIATWGAFDGLFRWARERKERKSA